MDRVRRRWRRECSQESSTCWWTSTGWTGGPPSSPGPPCPWTSRRPYPGTSGGWPSRRRHRKPFERPTASVAVEADALEHDYHEENNFGARPAHWGSPSATRRRRTPASKRCPQRCRRTGGRHVVIASGLPHESASLPRRAHPVRSALRNPRRGGSPGHAGGLGCPPARSTKSACPASPRPVRPRRPGEAPVVEPAPLPSARRDGRPAARGSSTSRTREIAAGRARARGSRARSARAQPTVVAGPVSGGVRPGATAADVVAAAHSAFDPAPDHGRRPRHVPRGGAAGARAGRARRRTAARLGARGLRVERTPGTPGWGTPGGLRGRRVGERAIARHASRHAGTYSPIASRPMRRTERRGGQGGERASRRWGE